MPAPIDFYFDFSSPFGYMASTRIDALASKYQREVSWRPILLGAVYKLNGVVPTPSVPLKGDYARRDIVRTARFHGIPCIVPTAFPIGTQSPARAFYWLQDRDAARAKQLAAAFYRAYFVDDLDISKPENTVAVAARQGLDAQEVAAAINDPQVKERLKREVDAAIARGVFGSPYVVVDGEPFWGNDRFDQLEKWLASGGI